jgi:hypothetical protein
MSANTETTSQPTTTKEPDDSPESWAAAVNETDEAQPDPAESSSAPSETSSTEEVSQGAGEEPEGAGEQVDDDPPPDFWSAERKALWAKIQDPEVRAAIKGHVEDASKAISSKMEEAAKARKAAEDQAKQYEVQQAQSVAWWQQFGPVLQKQLQGKWAGVDWAGLARENPAEYVAKKAEYDAEQAQFSALAQRQQQEAQDVARRAQEHHQRERMAEHQKIAAKYPKEFGTPEVAQKTYDAIAAYLVKEIGVPADRIPNIYESYVVETAYKAYKYDQLQKKAKEVTTPKPLQQDAAKTPTRVVPGAGRTANPSNEAGRQALQALRNGERMTAEQLADAFR